MHGLVLVEGHELGGRRHGSVAERIEEREVVLDLLVAELRELLPRAIA